MEIDLGKPSLGQRQKYMAEFMVPLRISGP